MPTILEYAQLARDAYRPNGSPSGWERKDSAAGSNGFFGSVYVRRGSEVVLAYRGTDEAKDWLGANRELANNLIPGQFNEAMTMFSRWQRQFRGTISVTGHSLGGALAMLVAAKTGVIGVVFDAPWMGLSVARCGIPYAYNRILNFRARFDVVSNVQDAYRLGRRFTVNLPELSKEYAYIDAHGGASGNPDASARILMTTMILKTHDMGLMEHYLASNEIGRQYPEPLLPP